MRAGGGKAKGASFEREICVMLSQWVSNGQQDDVFWRSAMSGGRATVAHKAKGKRLSNQVGDISAIHSVGNSFICSFAVECKFYRDLNYVGLLTGKGKIIEFWNEINQQARTHDKLPFLVARQNRMTANVCLNRKGVRTLNMLTNQFDLISYPLDIFIMPASRFVKVCLPFV